MNDLLQAIKKTLEKTELFKSVEIHGGGFSGVEDLKRFSQIAPSARVGLSNMGTTIRTPEDMLECNMALSIMFTAADINLQKTRHTEALKILETVLLIVKNGRWGTSNINIVDTTQDSVSATNYYGSNLYGTNVALWRVDWIQGVKLGTDRFLLKNKANK